MENDDKYLPQLLAEKDTLDPSFIHAGKLLNAEIDRLQKGDSNKGAETYLDLFTTKNIKLKERVLIPVKQYPKFNFVGKILGPQGNTIKRLQEETGAKISVLGKGSMRDKAKEEGLRQGGEPKYAHLSMELHVFIEVFAPVPEAYMRMAHAMQEVKKFLFPDMMDDICQEQFMEMGYLNGGQEPGVGRGGFRGRGGPPPGLHRGRGMPPRGAPPRGGVTRGGPVRGALAGRGGPPATPARGAAASRARPPAAGPPQRMAPPHQHNAAEGYDEYGCDESYNETSYDSYNSYYSQPQGEQEFYDYGHGDNTESYESYGQDDWNGTQRSTPGKAAPASRGAKSTYREHPYRQY
ncbi:KH domain-containing, RNA-binding, signal transduction-associated protein 1b isoform 1-T1 [Neosynchiropus ocellatus]